MVRWHIRHMGAWLHFVTLALAVGQWTGLLHLREWAVFLPSLLYGTLAVLLIVAGHSLDVLCQWINSPDVSAPPWREDSSNKNGPPRLSNQPGHSALRVTFSNWRIRTVRIVRKRSFRLANLMILPIVPKKVLHSEDWQRLYDVAIHVHLQHLPISSWHVVTYLVAHDFSHEAASRISAEFKRFIELLTRYDAQKTGPVKFSEDGHNGHATAS
jgi:hypothetical protein